MFSMMVDELRSPLSTLRPVRGTGGVSPGVFWTPLHCEACVQGSKPTDPSPEGSLIGRTTAPHCYPLHSSLRSVFIFRQLFWMTRGAMAQRRSLTRALLLALAAALSAPSAALKITVQAGRTECVSETVDQEHFSVRVGLGGVRRGKAWASARVDRRTKTTGTDSIHSGPPHPCLNPPASTPSLWLCAPLADPWRATHRRPRPGDRA